MRHESLYLNDIFETAGDIATFIDGIATRVRRFEGRVAYFVPICCRYFSCVRSASAVRPVLR